MKVGKEGLAMDLPRTKTPNANPLSLWDVISILLGIIIGVGIFESPALVFRSVSSPGMAMLAWTLGGVLSLLGALCFAELASAYPRSGGEYLYLTRAYGSGVGFLFAWAQLAVIRTGGGIAALAYVLAHNMTVLFGGGTLSKVWLACICIIVLTLINLGGVTFGKRAQNFLTIAKLVGLAGLIIAGFGWGDAGNQATSVPMAAGTFALAMIYVLYTYDGWNEAAYVAAEVRNRRRNLPLALILGTSLVTLIYLTINIACLVGLGFEGARSAPALMSSVLGLAFGEFGARAMCVLIIVSALGSINGTIFTGSRLFSEFGADHRFFASLGRWNEGMKAPVWALVVQGLISLAMVVAVGLGWRSSSGFEALVKCTAPVFWLFLLLTALAVLVLRRRDAEVERPFRVPLYPWTPILFCGWCGYMLGGSILYARQEALVGLGVLLAGIPLYLLSQYGRIKSPDSAGKEIAIEQLSKAS